MIPSMTLEGLRDILLKYPQAQEDYPFGDDVMVIKLHGKMFALVSVESDPLRVTLKCDPDDAQILRSLFPAVTPGYYMNKEHWNTIELNGSVPERDLLRMIEDSYQLVKSKLPAKIRKTLD